MIQHNTKKLNICVYIVTKILKKKGGKLSKFLLFQYKSTFVFAYLSYINEVWILISIFIHYIVTLYFVFFKTIFEFRYWTLNFFFLNLKPWVNLILILRNLKYTFSIFFLSLIKKRMDQQLLPAVLKILCITS